MNCNAVIAYNIELSDFGVVRLRISLKLNLLLIVFAVVSSLNDNTTKIKRNQPPEVAEALVTRNMISDDEEIEVMAKQQPQQVGEKDDGQSNSCLSARSDDCEEENRNKCQSVGKSNNGNNERSRKRLSSLSDEDELDVTNSKCQLAGEDSENDSDEARSTIVLSDEDEAEENNKRQSLGEESEEDHDSTSSVRLQSDEEDEEFVSNDSDDETRGRLRPLSSRKEVTESSQPNWKTYHTPAYSHYQNKAKITLSRDRSQSVSGKTPTDGYDKILDNRGKAPALSHHEMAVGRSVAGLLQTIVARLQETFICRAGPRSCRREIADSQSVTRLQQTVEARLQQTTNSRAGLRSRRQKIAVRRSVKRFQQVVLASLQ